MKAVNKIKKESIKFNVRNKDNVYYKITKRNIYIQSLVSEARIECLY